MVGAATATALAVRDGLQLELEQCLILIRLVLGSWVTRQVADG